jgi:oligo-1,6-glucosidase
MVMANITRWDPFEDIDDFQDLESVNHYHDAVAGGADPEAVLHALRTMGRDNARTPVQWDDSPHAGFTTGTPWMGVNPDYKQVNAEAALADPDSVLTHYRLAELRHTEPVVAHGDFTMLLPDDPDVYAFTRRLDDVELLVLGNFTGREVVATVPEAAEWAAAELVLGNVEPAEASGSDAGITLAPWEARVLRRSR